MSIGLFDADMAKYNIVPFNLEIMKLSAYYKKRHEIVVMSPFFHPERYSKFFYRKDYNDGDFPIGLVEMGIDYGGLAFSKNKYSPLPLEIERMKPDTSIYECFIPILTKDKHAKKTMGLFNNLKNSEHCRLSLDGKQIWPEYRRQIPSFDNVRYILFHDYDLGTVQGAYEEIKRLSNMDNGRKIPIKIGMKFPVQVYDGQTLINWFSLNPNTSFYSLTYNGIMEEESFLDWIKLTSYMGIFQQIRYNISGCPEQDFLTKGIFDIYHQVLISRSRGVFFLLMYDEGYFHDSRWERVINLFNYYQHSLSSNTAKLLAKVQDDTLYDFAKVCLHNPQSTYTNNCYSIDEIREIFEFVREKNYPLFKEFYECNARKLGGHYETAGN